MGKREREDVRRQLNADLARRAQLESEYIAAREPERQEARERTAGLFGETAAGYRGMLGLGGYDPTEYESLRQSYQGLLGGIPEESAIRQRGLRGVSSYYDTLFNEARRRQALTGGLGVGGELASLARKGSQQLAETTTDVEASLASLRQGRELAGLRGLSDLYGSVAGGRRDAVQGLAGLTGMSLDEQLNIARDILTRIQMGQQVSESELSILANLAQTPGIFDRIIAGVGAGAGAIRAIRGK